MKGKLMKWGCWLHVTTDLACTWITIFCTLAAILAKLWYWACVAFGLPGWAALVGLCTWYTISWCIATRYYRRLDMWLHVKVYKSPY